MGSTTASLDLTSGELEGHNQGDSDIEGLHLIREFAELGHMFL